MTNMCFAKAIWVRSQLWWLFGQPESATKPLSGFWRIDDTTIKDPRLKAKGMELDNIWDPPNSSFYGVQIDEDFIYFFDFEIEYR